MLNILKTKNIFLLYCITQILFCYFITKDSNYMFPMLFETFLLCCLAGTGRKFYIILVIPFLLINSIQLINIYSTGQYIVTITILNLRHYKDIGNHIYLLSFIFFIYILLFFFILLFKRVNIHIYIFILIVFISSECNFKQLSINNFFVIISETIEVLSLQYKNINKETFEQDILEYGSDNYNINIDKNKKYNIVVIFIEGTSYQILNNKLTKNLYSLMKSSINIENYYNHTATTYPGIRGQLISGYQINPALGNTVYKNFRIEDIPESIAKNIYDVESIPTILNKRGYNTFFISPHGEKDQFNYWLRTIGFDKVFTRKEDLSDRELYNFVIENIENLTDTKKPFFLCIYTLGTHHGFDSPDYKYNDGTNPYLNKFYNHDIWFGEFFDKFRQSKLYDNTILIVTSDHAPCPAPLYQKTFSINNDSFIDKIPFIIHFKGVNHIDIDALYRNSLSFAPTLLDILQIKLDKNYFLGNSIFVDDKSQFSHISNFVFAFYETSKDGVKVIDIHDEQYTKKIELIMESLKYFK